MLCRLLIDPPAPGSWNMALDEALLESAAKGGECSLRFYRWSQPTLSLGYFQPYDDRRRHESSRDCPVVRRPSGGGAILHDREITYSLAVPPGNRFAAKHLTLYEAVHNALIKTLVGFAIDAQLFRGQGQENDRSQKEPFLCFQRRCPGDVLLANVKIAGSAQRRLRGAVLQHGSVLLARSVAAPELPGIAEVAAVDLSFDILTRAWITELAPALSLDIRPGTINDSEQRLADCRAREKYGSSLWTENRKGKILANTAFSPAAPPY
jgi:lipoate-protein ligase A